MKTLSTFSFSSSPFSCRWRLWLKQIQWQLVLLAFGTGMLLGCEQDPAGKSVETTDSGAAASATETETNSDVSDPKAPLRIVEPGYTNLSPGLKEVIQLSQAQLNDELLISYIENSSFSFDPSVEEILYLADLGISEKVLGAIVRQRGKTAEGDQSEPTAEALSRVSEDLEQLHYLLASQQAKEEDAADTNYIAEPETDANAAVPAQEEMLTPESEGAMTYEEAPAENLPPQVDYFYDDLAPYGSWMELSDYGWCWQPTVVRVHSTWRPYVDRGRWYWSDHGWYWDSDYSWGWGPFHYGRWWDHPHYGWVWVPDSVWGPSWVFWRRTPQYWGWAPLPPYTHLSSHDRFLFHQTWVGSRFSFGLSARHFSFVPRHRFFAHYPRHHILPYRHVDRFFHLSIVVHNFKKKHHRVVENHGLPVDELDGISRDEIRKVGVRERPENTRIIPPLDRVTREGDGKVVYRPGLKGQESPGSVVASSRNQQERRKGSGGGTSQSSPRQEIPAQAKTVQSRPDAATQTVPARSQITPSDRRETSERTPSSQGPTVIEASSSRTTDRSPRPASAASGDKRAQERGPETLSIQSQPRSIDNGRPSPIGSTYSSRGTASSRNSNTDGSSSNVRTISPQSTQTIPNVPATASSRAGHSSEQSPDSSRSNGTRTPQFNQPRPVTSFPYRSAIQPNRNPIGNRSDSSRTTIAPQNRRSQPTVVRIPSREQPNRSRVVIVSSPRPTRSPSSGQPYTIYNGRSQSTDSSSSSSSSSNFRSQRNEITRPSVTTRPDTSRYSPRITRPSRSINRIEPSRSININRSSTSSSRGRPTVIQRSRSTRPSPSIRSSSSSRSSSSRSTVQPRSGRSSRPTITSRPNRSTPSPARSPSPTSRSQSSSRSERGRN